MTGGGGGEEGGQAAAQQNDMDAAAGEEQAAQRQGLAGKWALDDCSQCVAVGMFKQHVACKQTR